MGSRASSARVVGEASTGWTIPQRPDFRSGRILVAISGNTHAPNVSPVISLMQSRKSDTRIGWPTPGPCPSSRDLVDLVRPGAGAFRFACYRENWAAKNVESRDTCTCRFNHLMQARVRAAAVFPGRLHRRKAESPAYLPSFA